MQVQIYGARGSTPGQPRGSSSFGADTTCLAIRSDCIPPDVALAIDTGSGFTQLSRDAVQQGKHRIAVLYTHYHHDHTQGLLLAPHTHMPDTRVEMWGPKEHGVGPSEVLTRLMTPPFFPIEFSKVKDRFSFHPLENIGSEVLVVHPRGGFRLLSLDAYRKTEKNGQQIAFRNGRYDINECLVVHMFKTVHPEYTISYRFEEKPTGRVFVFLTDHEKTAALPQDLRKHLLGAHLLIQDAQYSEQMYNTRTAGYGHGTPEYAVDCAHVAGAECLGLTHHDPGATDDAIGFRLAEAHAYAEKVLAEQDVRPLTIFACAQDKGFVV